VSRILGLPEHVLPVGIVPIGWPAESPATTERMPPAEVTHYERFGQQR
jgi:nitroreductase